MPVQLKRLARHPRLWRVTGNLLKFGSVTAAVAILATCAWSPSNLSRIQRTDTLVVATPNSPTTYYLGPYGATGPDYDLASGLARTLGVKLKVLEVANGYAALQAVENGRADIAAPGVAVNAGHYPRLQFTPPYQMVSQLVVYRVGETVPANMADLAHADFKLTVAPEYAPLLQNLKTAHPGISWQVASGQGPDDLLVALAQGRIDYTIVNENEFRISRRFYPQLRIALKIGNPQPIAWAVARKSDSTLYQAATAYFAHSEASHRVAALLHRYYGDLDAYDQVSAQIFLNDVDNRLPTYVNSFDRASAATRLPWQLLAAVGYQESHWDAGAVSPTGVRGIMMLTTPTASRLGIHDRDNPHSSIVGGARYLAMLLRKLPPEIEGSDRLWMALASYNVGYGHVMDARKLVASQGGNPDRWADVKKVLPLLNQWRYYHHTSFGYANGVQAVLYVAHIKDYYRVLQWRTAQNSLPAGVIDPLQAAADNQPVSQ
ncbi:MAG: membrane-bound lytic murein transglycosylase MltF [Gammaproteobacteria bacterium]